MSYPVRLIGGTDRLQLTPDGPVYAVGQTIPDLSDGQRLALQQNGLRFETVHADTPAPVVDTPAPLLPPDQAAVNDEIAAAASKSKGKA